MKRMMFTLVAMTMVASIAAIGDTDFTFAQQSPKKTIEDFWCEDIDVAASHCPRAEDILPNLSPECLGNPDVPAFMNFVNYKAPAGSIIYPDSDCSAPTSYSTAYNVVVASSFPQGKSRCSLGFGEDVIWGAPNWGIGLDLYVCG